MFFYAGIADEAGTDIETQIKAHQELGWSHIELRNVDGKCITDISDDEFDAVLGKLNDAGIEVVGFGARLANWSRPIDTDLQIDIDEMVRAAARLLKCGGKTIRCMSYPNRKENPLDDDAWRDEVVRRLTILAKMAEDGGVTLVHENCDGWGGVSPAHCAELVTRVDSPAFKVVLDTGNPGNHDNDKHNALDWYNAVRPHIVHVHVKDYTRDDQGRGVMCYPGAGVSKLPDVLRDLLKRGYDGCLSIEPHMQSVIHLGKSAADDPEAAYKIYIKHGRQLIALMERLTNESRTEQK